MKKLRDNSQIQLDTKFGQNRPSLVVLRDAFLGNKVFFFELFCNVIFLNASLALAISCLGKIFMETGPLVWSQSGEDLPDVYILMATVCKIKEKRKKYFITC